MGSYKASRSLHSPTRILKVYIEDLTGFSHVYYPDGLNDTLLSQVYVLVMAPTVGRVGSTYIPRTGRRGGASDCPCPTQGSTVGHVLLTTSSNNA